MNGVIDMISNEPAVATIAVKDLQAAMDFYEKKLGLKKIPSPQEGVALFESGPTRVIVYKSEFAGTNKATAVTWAVDDVDGTVRELKSKGISFERYDFPNVKLEGDVHVFGKHRAAWFKDPDGNILALSTKG
jgi:predicted enzyme related to lactoylglutathione lyase